jgi:hypothetical protein
VAVHYKPNPSDRSHLGLRHSVTPGTGITGVFC